jgi:hypothetical protein
MSDDHDVRLAYHKAADSFVQLMSITGWHVSELNCRRRVGDRALSASLRLAEGLGDWRLAAPLHVRERWRWAVRGGRF